MTPTEIVDILLEGEPPTSGSVLLLLRSATTPMRRYVRDTFYEPNGLTQSMGSVMEALFAQKGWVRVQDMVESAALERTLASRAITALKERGLAETSMDADTQSHGNAQRVQLTGYGRKWYSGIHANILDWWGSLTKGIPQSDLSTYDAVNRRVSAAARPPYYRPLPPMPAQ